jgi:TatA/E family protein of Tat protein translocase
MFSLGWQETVFIFVLALLIFGPKKLPELGKTVGKALTEFRRASRELKSTFDREMAVIEQENQSIQQVTSEYSPDSPSQDYSHDSSYYDGEYPNYDSSDSTTPETSTVGASADQGADSTSGAAPDGAPPDGSSDGSPQSQPVPAADFQI